MINDVVKNLDEEVGSNYHEYMRIYWTKYISLHFILNENFTFPLCLKRITFPQFNRITFPYIVTFQKQNSTKQDKLIILCYFSGKLSTFPCTKRLLEAPSCH